MPRFSCPFCRSPLVGEYDAEVLCPSPACRQRLRTPPAQPLPVAEPGAAFSIDQTRIARVRVWAAMVRDRKGWQQAATPQSQALARTLCDLLDARSHIAADNALREVDSSVALLVGMIVLAGASWLPD